MGELTAGSVFAGHRIEAVAGRGGMGVVYRATQLTLDRMVALKVIAPGLIEDDATRRRFVRESKIAASIDHPNVIPIYYAGEEDGVAYIAMRYVAGDDLRSLVRREHRLEPRRAAQMVAQVSAALDSAHAAGLVHRDIKPANVLLGPEDHVYLTDFGLTKHALSIDGGTKPGHWVGTLDYVAPEQIRGERVDARADIYALGCLLFFTLVGHVPFDHEGQEAKLWAQLSEPPPKPSEHAEGIPATLDDVVERAMAKQPDDRYPSAGDLGRAAVAAAAGERPREVERLVAVGAAAPVEAPTVTTGRFTQTEIQPGASEAETRVESDPGRRSRSLGTGIAAAALAAGLVIGALVLGAGQDDPGGTDPDPPTPTPTPAPGAPTVEATIRTGDRPNAIATTDTGVFITSFRSHRVSVIDPATNQPLRRPAEIGAGGSDVAIAGRQVWVTVSRGKRLLRLHSKTGRRVGRAIPMPAEPDSLAGGKGVLWVGMITAVPGGPDLLARVDPDDGRIVKTVQIPEGIRELALSPGAVWIASRRSASVIRISTASGRVVGRVPVGRDRPADIAYGAGSVWATDSEGDTVWRIDPRTGDAVAIGVGGRPQGVAARGDQVWVTSYTDHSITRIDPRTSRRLGDPVAVALNPYAVAIGPDSVWVTCVGDDRVVRVRFKGRGA